MTKEDFVSLVNFLARTGKSKMIKASTKNSKLFDAKFSRLHSKVGEAYEVLEDYCRSRLEKKEPR